MENVETYIAFDLEFNTVDGVSHIIQVSAVKMDRHEEVGQFDSFVYSDVPLQSFINGLTGITADKIAKAPKLESVLADFKAFVGDTPLIGYNALKSDLPILAENGLDLEEQMCIRDRYVILEPEAAKGKWHELFGNDNPIHIEVGSGKGAFITGMAQQNPDINYIGIDIPVSYTHLDVYKRQTLYTLRY